MTGREYVLHFLAVTAFLGACIITGLILRGQS